MLRQIFQSRTNLQHQLGASISRSSSLLAFSARHFSTALSPVEEVERLPNEDTPWLMLNPEIDEATGDKLERFYSPGEKRMVKMNRKRCLKASNSAKCVGSTTGGWLGYVEPFDCSVFLSNPYLNKVFQLPSITTLPSVLDVKRDHSTGAVVALKMAIDSYDQRGITKFYPPPQVNSMIATMFDNMAMSRDESIVFAIQGRPRRAVYCSIGHDGVNEKNRSSSSEWTGLQEDYIPGRSDHQAVYSSMTNMFYTMFANTGIQAYDLETDRKNRSKFVSEFSNFSIWDELDEDSKESNKDEALETLKKFEHDTTFYIVPVMDSKNNLLLLRRYTRKNDFDSDSSGICAALPPYETFHFDVFLVLFDELKLVRVSDMGERSLFVGRNQSFCLNGDEFPGIRPNSIYFSDDRYGGRTYTNWGYDYGIFDLGENRILPLGYEENQIVPFSKDYNQFWVAPRLHFN